MSDRRKLSKKTRFDVFKRDGFTCQYCGQKPPAVVLEVDHVVPVCEGGGDDEANLLTACFDCNRGKGAGSLNVVPASLAEKAEMIAERAEQTAAYEQTLRQHRATQEEAIDRVAAIFAAQFPDYELNAGARLSIRHFLEKLPPIDLEEAMEIACSRMTWNRAFRYFCGVCWKKIKGD